MKKYSFLVKRVRVYLTGLFIMALGISISKVGLEGAAGPVFGQRVTGLCQEPGVAATTYGS